MTNTYKLNLIEFIKFIILTKNELYNKKNKEDLKKKLGSEEFKRETYSFYKYVNLQNIEELRDKLYVEWNALEILGRIYIAQEGINAQISIPEYNIKKFISNLSLYKPFENIHIKLKHICVDIIT